jgi:hypothetical protein
LKEGGNASALLANSKKAAGFERANGTVGGSKASEGKPHERNRDAISPAGYEGSKTLRGRETLRT